jgi:hypothetical protein
MATRYHSIDEILGQELTEPETLDVLVVRHRGVALHVHGFLHGVTGAGNRRYRAMVQRTINASDFAVLIEKGFSRVYSGIAAELEDWAPIPIWQTFAIPGRFAMNPTALGAMIGVAVSEQFGEDDRFAADPRTEHLGDSPKFHLLEPFERRRICGFPDPEAYLRINLDRYFHPFAKRFPAVSIPDPRWIWMKTLEPASCISLRSIHMLEFAAAFALEHGFSDVTVLVGETHNTDMAWLAERFATGDQSGWNERERALIATIRERADALGRAAAQGRHFEPGRLAFEAAFGSGVVSVLALAAAGIFGGAVATKSLFSALAKEKDGEAAA